MSLLAYCRAAIIVGKYGHTIVKRNRLRRQLRELARINLIPLCVGQDLIVRALPTAYTADFRDLRDEINWIKMQITLNHVEG